MKDEIKEIELDHFNNINELKQNVKTWIKKDEMYWERWFSLYDLKALLDYITNLQEELKEYKMLFDAFSERPYAHRYLEEKKKELDNSKIIGLDSEMIYKDYYDLKEENERLKEIKKEHKNCTRKHWQQKCAEHCANEMIYKSRNEKAIEYINNLSNEPNIFGHYGIDSRCKEWLLNILNGDDK